MSMVSADYSIIFSPPQRDAIASALRQLLPEDCILLKKEDLGPYSCDGLSVYRQLPLAAVLPKTVEQVQAVVRYCHQQTIPIVPRGSGTGLSGGALPHHQGILLNLGRLNKILDIDIDARSCRVQPGVRNLAVSDAVRPQGLYYAPDPSSQIACTIGGNIAENSGGVHCLKYGLTVHNVMQIKLVLANGELATIGSGALDAPGYDLLALVTGSEGLLGIVVEATLKLLPVPEHAQVLMAAFDDVVKAGNAVGDVIAAGIIPAGMEMMDHMAIGAAEDFVNAGYPKEAQALLLCELDGTREEVEDGISQVKALMMSAGASTLRVSEDNQQRSRLWAGRKAAFPAIGRISPDYYCMDGTIPRNQLPHVLSRMQELSAHYGLRVANVFHAGDGNLHPLILFDANKSGELQKAEQFGSDILQMCIEAGGTITGEHGVGMEKLNNMCSQFAPAELEQFHAVKQAFDPNHILNPGKAVPTLHRCAEFGAMHVHEGKLPFPDLPRF